MFIRRGRSRQRTKSFPRVSGDVSKDLTIKSFVSVFSPRERGCFRLTFGYLESSLVFPA